MKGSSQRSQRSRQGELTGDEAKAAVHAKGMTLKEFASRHGLPYRIVSEVVRGVNKGVFGQGHRAAVALGMKRGA